MNLYIHETDGVPLEPLGGIRKDVVLLALLAAAVLLLPLSLFSDTLVSADQDLFLDIWNSDGKGTDSLCRMLTELGSVYFWGLITLFLWVTGRRELALYLLLAMTMQFFIGAGMKMVIDRPRPFEEFLIDTSYTPIGSSFPSGHTLGMTTACVTIALRKRWTTLPLAGTLVLVGSSRILLGVHYPLDVLAAAVIGLLTAFYVGNLDLSPAERRMSLAYDSFVERLKAGMSR